MMNGKTKHINRTKQCLHQLINFIFYLSNIMTNQEFIQSDKVGSFQNLRRDEDGTLYSYGSHYPLKWEIDGVTFRNTSGYSVTTSKHIGYTQADHDVELHYSDHTSGKPTRKQTLDALQKEFTALAEEMNSKKRTDTQVYQRLSDRYYEIAKAMRAI